MRTNFCFSTLVFLLICKILLAPGVLLAQQKEAVPSPQTSFSLKSPLDDYFNCLNACPGSLPIEQYFSCLDDCSYPRVDLERKKVNQANMLEEETLKENNQIQETFETIIQERLKCFSEVSSIQLRIRSCRKEYIRDIMTVAKQINRAIRNTRKFRPRQGHRQLGRFVTCVRDCPISLAICRGDIALGLYKGTCDKKEFQCLEQCFINYYL